MRLSVTLLVALIAGCGALPSGPGTPPPVPSSGLGASTPWSDDTGLSWTPPFIFADPSQALFHPSAIEAADAPGAIDLWAESTRGASQSAAKSTIIHSRATSFEAGFVDSDDVLMPSLPWHDTLHAPSVVAVDDDLRYLFYLSSGEVGICALPASCRAMPLYTDAGGRIRSIAAARVDDAIHVVILVGESLSQLTIPTSELPSIVDNGAAPLTAVPIALDIPSWATGFLDVALRADETATGRWREDLFYACSLPTTADLGTMTVPSAIGAASRYADAGPAFAIVAQPILGGSPAPRAPTSLPYQGGVLLLYSAQSGPRQAIAVARHP